jgi:hypothetical protein
VPTDSFSLKIDACLDHIPVSLLSEWDVLVFLYRHGTSLASASQIALLVGYGRSQVGKALDGLVAAGFIQRSRSSQGARLYRFALPIDPAYRQNMEQLLELSETRGGRLILSGRLRERARHLKNTARTGLHLA